MKTSLIAALLLAGSAIVPAAAQSTVTLYGVIDAGMDVQRGGVAGAQNKITSGIQTPSRIGFRGNEDLGGGLSALFVLENGFAVDSGAALQGGALFGRQAFVGLKSPWGMVTAGRQYTPIFLSLCAEIDPFSCGLAGNAANLMSQGGTPTGGGNGARTNNSIKYTAPVMHGWSADVMVGLGESALSSAAARTLGATLGYTDGAWTLRLMHNTVNDATASRHARVTVLGAKVRTRAATVHLAYAINKGAFSGGTSVPQANTRDLLLGVSAPFGPHTLLASYIGKSDKSAAGNDAHQLAAGYTYAMSRRTNLFASYGTISNTVANTAGSAGGYYTSGNATDAGSGDRSFNLGVHHTF